MELRHLTYFLAVVDRGSTTSAAESCHITQPSLSRQLRGLERDLRVALFHRDSGRLRLTAAGQRFVPIARDLISRADSAATIAAALATGQPPALTITAPVTTITDVIAPFIATTGPNDPFLTAREELPAVVYPTLTRGSDLAISSVTPPADVRGRPIARLPILAYVRPDHPMAGRDSITVSELAEQPLIVLSSEHRTRRLLDDALLTAGVGGRIVFETSIPQVAQALAASGHGTAVVSDDARYGLHPLSISTDRGPLSIRLYAAWDPDHYAEQAIAALVDRLSAFCVARYGAAADPSVAPEKVQR
jgi:DNA-binding transcriptional LysR family regulator